MLGTFFSIDALETEFQSLLRAKHDVFEDEAKILPGEDRIQLEHFERDKDKHFKAISRKALEGRYTFKEWRVVGIPKGNGEERNIAVSGIRDALVQRCLYRMIYDRVDQELGPQSYGFRKGRSAHNAVLAVRDHFRAGRKTVFDADISKFFDSVPHDKLLARFEALGFDDATNTLVRRYLSTGYCKKKDGIIVESAERRLVGLPQGGVLSGLLANLYLADFDKVVTEKFGGLVRYADDFVICCVSPAQGHKASDLCTTELHKLGLNLHDGKTHLNKPAAQGVDFLGFTITPTSLRIKQGNIDSFKARIDADVVTPWLKKEFEGPVPAFQDLIRRINFKVRGPGPFFLNKMLALGMIDHRYRRNWPSYFRIVDDIEQFRELDRWIRSRISQVCFQQFGPWGRATLRDMRDPEIAGEPLHSLVNAVWKSRRKLVKPAGVLAPA